MFRSPIIAKPPAEAKVIRYVAAMEARRDDEIEIALADPLADKEVLALAALAWPEADRAASWQDIRQAALVEPASVALFAARQQQRVIGAALAQIVPGRAAVVWPPQLLRLPQVSASSAAAPLLRKLIELLAHRGAMFAQALLPCGEASASGLFAAGGFRRVAELLYLCGEADCFPADPPRLPVRMQPAEALDDQQLCNLIDRTYSGTLDCPQLDGLRDTADVIRGYRAVGEYRPNLWQIAFEGDRAVGCLLVNVHPPIRHAELVYMGLVPEVRGRGWGLLLTRQALWLATAAGCQRLVLAVDSANGPAIGAYRAAGLSAWDRREIWILPLAGGVTA